MPCELGKCRTRGFHSSWRLTLSLLPVKIFSFLSSESMWEADFRTDLAETRPRKPSDEAETVGLLCLCPAMPISNDDKSAIGQSCFCTGNLSFLPGRVEAFFFILEVLMRLGLRSCWFILLRTQHAPSPRWFTSPSMLESSSHDSYFSLPETQCSALQGFSIYLMFLLPDWLQGFNLYIFVLCARCNSLVTASELLILLSTDLWSHLFLPLF